jgi:hypothetical protein
VKLSSGSKLWVIFSEWGEHELKRDSGYRDEIVLVDSSGQFIDGGDFAHLNLRFPQLEKVLVEMTEKDERLRLIWQPHEGTEEVQIQMLDREGFFWRVWQEKTVRGEKEENPSIRFLYYPEREIIRPVDYRDPYVELEGKRRDPQVLIASFLTHWLSGLLILADRDAM